MIESLSKSLYNVSLKQLSWLFVSTFNHLIEKMAENCENVSLDFLERNVTSSDLFYLNQSHQHFPCTERHETEKSTKILHIREAAFRKYLAFSEELP